MHHVARRHCSGRPRTCGDAHGHPNPQHDDIGTLYTTGTCRSLLQEGEQGHEQCRVEVGTDHVLGPMLRWPAVSRANPTAVRVAVPIPLLTGAHDTMLTMMSDVRDFGQTDVMQNMILPVSVSHTSVAWSLSLFSLPRPTHRSTRKAAWPSTMGNN
jgi:hypothetical protein